MYYYVINIYIYMYLIAAIYWAPELVHKLQLLVAVRESPEGQTVLGSLLS